MTTKSKTMFFATVMTVAFIIIAISKEGIATIIGAVGAGIVFIIGLGFSFLIEHNEEEEIIEE